MSWHEFTRPGHYFVDALALATHQLKRIGIMCHAVALPKFRDPNMQDAVIANGRLVIKYQDQVQELRFPLCRPHRVGRSEVQKSKEDGPIEHLKSIIEV